MTGHGILVGMAMSVALFAYACGGGTTDPPPPRPDPPRATTVTVSPATVELAALGATEQLAARVLDQNGNAMAGAVVTWSSGDASVATVDASGLATAAGNGTATITATSGRASGSAAVTVAQAVAAVAVSPAADTLLAEGDTVRLAAAANDANGHAVTEVEFVWASADTSVATVDGSGLVTSGAAGEIEITATASGVAGSAALTVVAQVPTTIAVTPDAVAFTALEQTAQLSAEVRDQIGRSIEDAAIAWSSGDTLVATIDSAGLVRARANGTATITASAGPVSRGAAVTVAQEVDSVIVSPAMAMIGPGDTLRLTPAAVDANGHPVADAEFEWSSSDARFATVDAAGLVTGTGRGAAVVSAAVDEVEGSAAVAVGIEAPVWIAFAADSLRLAEGETRVAGVRYWARELAAPLVIGVSAAEDGAEAADYELSETRFEIPAGNGVAGTFDFTVAARTDDAFAEGEEGVALELSVPGAVEAEVGAALPVRIADAPVAACVGVTLAGTPPVPVEAVEGLQSLLQRRDRIRTSLTSGWRPSASKVTMRWAGPYGEVWEWFDFERHLYYQDGRGDRAKPFPVQPDFHIESWRIEPQASLTTHVMDVSWSAEAELELVFRCETGEVVAACDSEGCGLRDAAASPSTSGQSVATPFPGFHASSGRAGQGSALLPDGNALSPPFSAASRGAYLHDGGWHPSAWPPGDTLVFHLSSENWPEDAQMTPDEAKEVFEKLFAEWSAIPTADMAVRVEGPVSGLLPQRDGKNIIWIYDGEFYNNPNPVVSSWYYDGTYGSGLVELDYRMGPNNVRRPKRVYDNPWPYIVDYMGMHPLGHMFGLGHAGTFPVFASCPGPTIDDCGRMSGNLGYWRGVSGAWQLDPIMSYGVSGSLSFTDEGTALRLDDKIGASLLRPAPGWLEATGTIAGSVRTDDGLPVPHIHVWAVRPDERGLMDGVGSFADRNGDFRIRGLPPGDWTLIAHPDLSWIANPWFFYERQGELLDEMLLYPVRAVAGQTTGGIEITMSRGRVTTVP